MKSLLNVIGALGILGAIGSALLEPGILSAAALLVAATGCGFAKLIEQGEAAEKRAAGQDLYIRNVCVELREWLATQKTAE